MESIYTELALYGSKKSVLGLILSSYPYLRSAMVRFPFTTCVYFRVGKYSPASATPTPWRSGYPPGFWNGVEWRALVKDYSSYVAKVRFNFLYFLFFLGGRFIIFIKLFWEFSIFGDFFKDFLGYYCQGYKGYYQSLSRLLLYTIMVQNSQKCQKKVLAKGRIIAVHNLL